MKPRAVSICAGGAHHQKREEGILITGRGNVVHNLHVYAGHVMRRRPTSGPYLREPSARRSSPRSTSRSSTMRLRWALGSDPRSAHPTSFVAQRDIRIYLHCSPCRYVASRCANSNQHEGNRRQREWIVGSHIKKQVRD